MRYLIAFTLFISFSIAQAQDSYLIYDKEADAKAALAKINTQYGWPDGKGSDTWAVIEYIPTLNGRWCIPIDNVRQWKAAKNVSTFSKADIGLSPKVQTIAQYKALEIKPSKSVVEEIKTK